MMNLNVLCHTMDSKKTAIFPSSGSLCRFRIIIAVLRTNVEHISEVIVLTLLAESLFHVHCNKHTKEFAGSHYFQLTRFGQNLIGTHLECIVCSLIVKSVQNGGQQDSKRLKGIYSLCP